MIVATAGHVDHGKSTLVRLLTGADPDRWDEEKRRGLTIDLGFAWMSYEAGGSRPTLGFVDVPGHRRFLPNMLAGCGAVDLALLVVSAREGWMPQTEEHTQILDLLGVDRGVIAVTHRDAVGDEEVRRVAAEAADRVRDTSLEGAPVVATAASDDGTIDDLRSALVAVAEAEPASTEVDRGRPRLWIDRSFTLKGTGRVVTGTLSGGALAVGDEISVVDGEGAVPAHVRGVHVYGDAVDRAAPGCRVGLSLSRLQAEPDRGHAVVRARQWEGGRRWQVVVRPVRGRSQDLEARGGYQVFLGTAHTSAQLRYGADGKRRGVDGPVLARLHLREAIAPVAVGDRFILRDESTDSTVGGGVILAVDREPHRYERSNLEARWRAVTDHGSSLELASALVDQNGGAVALESLERQVGPLDLLAGVGGTLRLIDQQVVDTDAYTRRADGLMDDVGDAGQIHEPEDPLGRLVADELVGQGRLERRSAMLQAPGTAGAEFDDALSAMVHALDVADPPLLTPDELRECTGQVMRHQSAAVRAGVLVEVGPFVTNRDRFEQLAASVRDTLRAGPAPVSAFREQLGLSRKYLIPLLETLDRRGRTIRDGNDRTWVDGAEGSGDAHRASGR